MYTRNPWRTIQISTPKAADSGGPRYASRVSQPFEVFGPYAVYERLGQGGMATVHRAEKRGIGIRRPVALKRLLPHVAADPALVKLFVNEARLATPLRPATVPQPSELAKVGDTFAPAPGARTAEAPAAPAVGLRRDL